MFGFRPLSFFLMFSVLFGFSLLIFGVILLILPLFIQIDFDNSSIKIENLNTIIKKWNTNERDVYSKFEMFLVTKMTVNNETVTRFLNFKEDSRTVDIPPSRQIETSEPFKWRFFGNNIIDSLKYDETLFVKFSLKSIENPDNYYNNKKHNIANDDVQINSFQLPLFFTTQISPTTKEKCRGYFNPELSECKNLFRLKGVCVKIIDTYDIPILDRKYGGFGCRPTPTPYSSFLGEWSPGYYYSFVLPKVNETLQDHIQNWNDFNFIVRSSKDPYIYAQHITNGTLNFHDLEKVISNWNIIKVYLQFGTMISGIVVIILSLLITILLCSTKKTRYLLFVHMKPEHEVLLKKIRNEDDLRGGMIEKNKGFKNNEELSRLLGISSKKI